MKKTAPIGVFDSGVGGVSVLCEVRRLLPHEDLIYYGDNKNAPYGTKSAAEVTRCAEACFRFLLEKGCKIVIVACNTATAVAVNRLRENYAPFPIVGIEPAVKPAVRENPGKRVLLLATPLTLRQERVLAMAEKYDSEAILTMKGAAGLVELIEEGHTNDETLFSFLQGLFSDERSEGRLPDAVVLGCTHYPHVKEAIRTVLGGRVKLYDGGEGTARRCRDLLAQSDMLSDSPDPGKVSFFGSDPDKIPLCRKLFQEKEE